MKRTALTLTLLVACTGCLRLDGNESRDATSARLLCQRWSGASNPLDGREPTPVLLASGLRGSEGPVWIGDALYFSDLDRTDTIPWEDSTSSHIMRFDESTAPEIWLEGGGTNGLALLTNRTLVGAAQDRQQVSAFDVPTLARSEVVGSYLGLPFNSPNDLDVGPDGAIYFSDPTWQRGPRPGQEGDATRVYRYAPDGQISVIDDTLLEPNGVTITLDGRTLYVTSISTEQDRSDGNGPVTRYRLDGEGRVLERDTFLSPDDLAIWPDGMTVDCAGNLYVTTFAGVEIFDPVGTRLGVISIPGESGNRATNVAFGGQERTTLYITATGDLWRAELTIPGRPN